MAFSLAPFPKQISRMEVGVDLPRGPMDGPMHGVAGGSIPVNPCRGVRH